MGYYNENYSEDDLTSCDIEWGAGMMGGGMMEWGYTGSTNADPLTLDQAHDAVEEFLADLNNSDLELGEVMIFDNHAYAQIVEESTGIGALEVLVDPVTLAVYPELGPNMMLNLKYGMMSGFSGSSFGGHGMMGGGMMGGFGFPGRSNYLPANISDEMPVSPEQAVEAAQDYLDSYLPDYQADEYADPFYGYYTLHTLKDGEVVGMLSVNGFSGQVFLHTWHGELLEMTSGHD